MRQQIAQWLAQCPGPFVGATYDDVYASALVESGLEMLPDEFETSLKAAGYLAEQRQRHGDTPGKYWLLALPSR